MEKPFMQNLIVRKTFKKQFTATVYVVHDGKVLLVKHRKFNKWLPPGGHVDRDETPVEAAKREVFEETGFEIEFIRDEHLWIEAWNGKSIERPFFCILFDVPEHKEEKAHQHIDFIYVAQLKGGQEIQNSREIEDLRWFSLEEILKLEGDVEIFKETQSVIQVVLSKIKAMKDN